MNNYKIGDIYYFPCSHPDCESWFGGNWEAKNSVGFYRICIINKSIYKEHYSIELRPIQVKISKSPWGVYQEFLTKYFIKIESNIPNILYGK